MEKYYYGRIIYFAWNKMSVNASHFAILFFYPFPACLEILGGTISGQKQGPSYFFLFGV